MKQDFLAEIEALARQAGEDRRRQRDKMFPQQSLSWLALAPVWPVELARQGFPVEDRSISEGPEVEMLLQSAVDNKLGVQQSDMLWPDGTLRLNDGARQSILEDLSDDPDKGEPYLRGQLVESSEHMTAAAQGGLSADPRLQRWVTLAQASGDEEQMARVLEVHVQAAIEQAERKGHLSAPAAVAWIKTAKPLGELLGGSLAISILRCERRVELFHRRSHDIRLLSNYFVRAEYDRAFLDLLENEEQWALHLVGVGGTGKTMTLRHITHELAEKHGLATARVDFDYLNPDYPFRAPGLLLVELSEDFRLQISDSSEYLFSRFDDAVKVLKDRIQGEVHRGPIERPSTSDPEFREMVEYFAQAIHNLGSRRPILILDTCEELAKIKPDGTIPDNVQVTFEILEMLHEQLPHMRVVLSGRRNLPEQPYMRVVRIRGFTTAEASRFLSDFTTNERSVDTALHQPILDLTRVSIVDEEPRHNPYDLDMYCSWAVGDPDLSPEKLAEGGSHHYVKERIVGRLTPAMRILLRSLALIRRFDRRLLEELLEDDPNGDNLILEVNELEIVERHQAADGSLLINPTLRLRLLDYYEHEQRGPLTNAKIRVADLLERITLEWEFSILTPQHFAAALDTLSDDPLRAAKWWSRVEQRIRRERQWTWALEALLTFEEEPALVDNRKISIAATVEATMVACSVHTERLVRNSEAFYSKWAGVQDELRRFPEGREHRQLTLRAELALASTRAGTHDVPVLPEEAAGDEELQFSYLSYLESWTELAEIQQPAGSRLAQVYTGVLKLLNVTPETSRLAAFALCLEARLVLVFGSPADANPKFRNAHDIANRAVQNERKEDHLDWIAPESLLSRVRLEEMRAWSKLERKDEEFFAAAQPDLGETEDDDRLAALILQGWETREPLRQLSKKHFEISLENLLSEPRCNAHREIPPYCQVVLEAQARAGSLNQPLEKLRELSETAEAASRIDLSRQLDCARLRIMYRMGLLSENYSVPSSLQSKQETGNAWMWLARRFYVEVPDDSDKRQKILNDWMEAPIEGKRRTAEIALLSASLPKEGNERPEVAEFLVAASHFDDCGDDMSSLLATIASDLRFWSVHTRPDAPQLGEPDILAYAYKRAVKSDAAMDWPSWEELQGIVSDGIAPSFLDKLSRDALGWRPCLVRLCICLAHHQGSEGERVRADLKKWLVSNYSVTYQEKEVLPYDLRFVIAETERTSPSSPSPVVARPSSDSMGVRLWQKITAVAWREIGFGVLGLGVGIALFWMMYHFLGRGLALMDLPTDWPVRLPVFVAIMALIAYSGQITSAFLTWYFRFISVEFRFCYDPPPRDTALPMSTPGRMIERVRWHFGPFRWNITKPGKGERQLKPTEEKSYRRLAPALLDNTKGLARIHRLAWRGFHDINVIVDEQSAGGPWEAVLGFPSERIDRFSKNRFRFRRTTDGKHQRLQSDLPAGTTFWAICDREGPRHHVDQFLRKLETSSSIMTRSTRTKALEQQDSGAHSALLYICGAPMGGTSGLRIRTSLGKVSSPDVIRPRELPSEFGQIRLLILQIPPAPLSKRSSGDRKEAALAKQIGAELFASGVPSVLIIPPLWGDLNDTFFNGLGELMHKSPRNATPRLVKLVRTLQDAIAKTGEDEETKEAALERAIDVCLYAGESVNLRIQKP